MHAFVALVALSLAVLGRAQATPPSCALNCLATTPTDNCGEDDTCLCNDTKFIQAATSCIQASCTNPSDLQAAEQFAQQLCLQASVTLSNLLPSSTGATGSGSPPAPTATGPSTSAPTGASSTGSPASVPPSTANSTPNTSPAPVSGADRSAFVSLISLTGAMAAFFLTL